MIHFDFHQLYDNKMELPQQIIGSHLYLHDVCAHISLGVTYSYKYINGSLKTMRLFGQSSAHLFYRRHHTFRPSVFFLSIPFSKITPSKQILLIRCKSHKHSGEPRREKAVVKRNSKMSSRGPLIPLIYIIHAHSKWSGEFEVRKVHETFQLLIKLLLLQPHIQFV